MNMLTDIMDRLTDIRTLRVQIEGLTKEQGEMRKIVLKQQTELAEVRGQLKALIQMQGRASKK